jgi:hypothetical protein
MNRETAEACTILRGLVGSTVHGLNVNDGIEDRDEMGICVEPLAEAMSLWAPFEQFIYRTAEEREGRANARSTAGDLDLTIYSLRKWMRLALKGNPTILLLLFTPDDQLMQCDALGAELRALLPAIISRRVQAPFLGYLQAQKQRLTGERGQKRIHRPELEEMYGFDCYSDDTEFLTRHGWKLFDEIADGAAVATVNQASGQIEFQVPSERICKPYDGVMLEWRQRYTSVRVTPNHRMRISKVQRGPAGIHGDAYRTDVAEWRFARADEMASMDRVHVQVAGVARTQEYGIDDGLLRLIGAYVSEGCIAKRLKSGQPSVVALSQKVGNRLDAVIEASAYAFNRYVYVRSEPWRSSSCESATYTLADRQLAVMLSEECGERSRHKHLPAWAFELSRRQADVLLDALIAGDGTTHKRTGYRIYYTNSRRLAGDVQALAVTAGYRANVWGPYQDGMYQVLVTTGGPYQAIGCRINLRTHERAPRRIVCFTVPNEILLTRRDGRVAMHGNTKYAMHMLRLGFQGVELLTTGRLSLPMREPERSYLLDVRRGKVSEQDCFTRAGQLEQELTDLATTSPLPDEPEEARVEAWMLDAYRRRWASEPRQD